MRLFYHSTHFKSCTCRVDLHTGCFQIISCIHFLCFWQWPRACLRGFVFCVVGGLGWVALGLSVCCICGIHGISFRSRSYLVRILFTSPSQFTFQYRKNEICSFTAPIDLCALRQPRKWYKIHAELQADYNKATNIFKIPREHFFLNLAVTLADASKSFIQRDQI